LFSKEEIQKLYVNTSSVKIQKGGTDLSDACINTIVSYTLGSKVLDVGCGNGVLGKILSNKHKVTACDIVIDPKLRQNLFGIQFLEANIENLPFGDRAFDTVTCSHTLEHTQDIFAATKELRRVTKKRLIIIVPRERPYRYTFNLHLHFFPHKYVLLMHLLPSKEIVNQSIKLIDGCWYYQEDREGYP